MDSIPHAAFLGIPLLLALAAVIAVSFSAGWLARMLAILAVGTGGAGGWWLLRELEVQPTWQLMDAGFKVPLRTADKRNGSPWEMLPWLAGSGGKDDRGLPVLEAQSRADGLWLQVRAETGKRGDILVTHPKIEGSGHFPTGTAREVKESTEIDWGGQTFVIQLRTDKDAKGEPKKGFQLLVGGQKTVTVGTPTFPSAWRLGGDEPDKSPDGGLYLTMRDEKLWLIQVPAGAQVADAQTPPTVPATVISELRVDKDSVPPQLEWQVPAAFPVVQLWRWVPDEAGKSQGRFVGEGELRLTFAEQVLTAVRQNAAREKTRRLRGDFLARPSLVHFVTSRWLYENPDRQMGSGPGAPGEVMKEPLVRVDTSRVDGNQIAFTFDDGPNASLTHQILDKLRDKKAHATFFVVGSLLEGGTPEVLRRREAVKRMFLEGHEVANHTWSHPKWRAWLNMGNDKRRAEVTKGNDMIMALAREAYAPRTLNKEELERLAPRYFRPPGGDPYPRDSTEDIISRFALTNVFWSVDPQEWKKTPEGVRKSAPVVAADVLRDVRDGGIVIMHDIHAATVQAFDQVVTTLANEKWQFLTLSEMRSAAESGTAPPVIRLPVATGGKEGSYVTLSHMPPTWHAGELQVVAASPRAVSMELDGRGLPTSAEGMVEVPALPAGNWTGGAYLIKLQQVDTASVMRWVMAAAALVGCLCMLKWCGHWSATVFAIIFVLAMARLVLSLGADRVYPLDREIWTPPSLDGISAFLASVKHVWPTWVTVLLPFGALGVASLIAHLSSDSAQRGKIVTHSRWVEKSGYYWTFAVVLAAGLAVWFLPGKEKAFGLFLKSAIYIPVLALLAGWLAGPGDWRYGNLPGRTGNALDWSRLLVFLLVACAAHAAGAVISSDLGAVLVIGPVAAVVLLKIFAVENWWWRGLLSVVLLCAGWGFLEFAGEFISLVAEGRQDRFHMPFSTWLLWTLAGALCALALYSASGTKTNLGQKQTRLTVWAGIAFVVLPCAPTVLASGLAYSDKVQEKIQKGVSEYYIKYVRLRSNDSEWLQAEGTRKAMEVYEDLELVNNYGKGGFRGSGYLSPPITTEHDNYFNDYMLRVFVKGQFGMAGLGAFMAAFAALILWGGALPDHGINRPGGRFWVVTARTAAWIWGGISLFMAASNLGLFPLTGKNAMLLGLDSGSDVLEAGILATLMLAGALVMERRTPRKV